MAELLRDNALQAIENYIQTLHPDQFIHVIYSNQYYYLYDTDQFVRIWESEIYAGKASKFQYQFS